MIGGLSRELREELGVCPMEHRPLIRVAHQYSDRGVLLDVHAVTRWQGSPVGREGQPLAWAEPETLRDYPMPEADRPVVSALQLPSQYLITPPAVKDRSAFMGTLESRLRTGVRLLQLRVFGLSQMELLDLGRSVCDLAHAYQARVLLNGSAQTAVRIGADGVHLSSRALSEHQARPVAPDQLLAASCHSPEDLAMAAGLGVDFAVLSPVLPTPSHPDAEPLGWSRFAAWVDAAVVPTYALGGMQDRLTETAWAHGAQGIAGIRGLWGDEQAG